MNENRQASGFINQVIIVLALLLVIVNIYSGVTVQEIGIPGLFMIKFGRDEQPPDSSTSPTEINPVTPRTGINSVRLEAENYSEASAHVSAIESGGIRYLGYINDGEWTKYDNINLGSGEIHALSARVASGENGGEIEVHLDGPNERLVGTCHVPPTGGWEIWRTVSCDIKNGNITDVDSIYLVYTGEGTYLFNIDWLDFN